MRYVLAITAILTLASSAHAQTSGPSTEPAKISYHIIVSGKNAVITISGGNFPVRNAMWELAIGDQKTSLSTYPASGATDTLIFFMPIDAFKKTKDGDAMSVSDGAFAGTLDKSAVIYQN